MTRNKQQKVAARNRAAQNSEPYAEALRHVRGGNDAVTPNAAPRAGDDREFVALCGACNDEVAPKAGMVWIAGLELQGARDALERCERDRIDRFREAEALGDRLTAEDYLRLCEIKFPENPWPARWQIHHYACWDELDNDDTRMADLDPLLAPYNLDTGRLRSYAELAWMTAHFGNKGFFRTTDWDLVEIGRASCRERV